MSHGGEKDSNTVAGSHMAVRQWQVVKSVVDKEKLVEKVGKVG